MLILTSCGTIPLASSATEPKVVDSFCAVAKPIHPSRQDTDGTLRQIIAHNQIGIDKCGWGKPSQ